MTRVDFYLLPSAEPDDRLPITCRLAEKAWRQGMTVFVRCADETQRQRLDEWMWRYNPHAFLPHDNAETAPDTPICLALPETSSDRCTFLINLAEGIPSYTDAIERIAELVIERPENRRAARESFRYYRDQGYSLQHHRLTHL